MKNCEMIKKIRVLESLNMMVKSRSKVNTSRVKHAYGKYNDQKKSFKSHKTTWKYSRKRHLRRLQFVVLKKKHTCMIIPCQNFYRSSFSFYFMNCDSVTIC